MNRNSASYSALCTDYYDLERPEAPADALQCYLRFAEEANGPILEPMCGTGRFLIPLLERGYAVTGFDCSPYMLDRCRRKCIERGLSCSLLEATFETISLPQTYDLIYIPSGSFCHLFTPHEIARALKFVSNRLNPGGKFVVEIETLKAVREPQEVWRGSWVEKPDGSKIVRHTLSRFNTISRVETVLFRYELWEQNTISRIEVEDFRVKLYEPMEIEQLLEQHGLKVIGKWRAEPKRVEADATSPIMLYESTKNR